MNGSGSVDGLGAIFSAGHGSFQWEVNMPPPSLLHPKAAQELGPLLAPLSLPLLHLDSCIVPLTLSLHFRCDRSRGEPAAHGAGRRRGAARGEFLARGSVTGSGVCLTPTPSQVCVFTATSQRAFGGVAVVFASPPPPPPLLLTATPRPLTGRCARTYSFSPHAVPAHSGVRAGGHLPARPGRCGAAAPGATGQAGVLRGAGQGEPVRGEEAGRGR